MLHMINKAPEHPRFQSCLATLTRDDTLVLLENAVLALLEREFQSPCPVYALKTDSDARGVTPHVPADQLVDAAELVRLTAANEQLMNW